MTADQTRIEIPLNKTKIILMFMGAVVIVIIGFGLVIAPQFFRTYLGPFSPLLLRLVGVLYIIFFGLCLYYFGRKVFDKKPGLVIDEQGIIDNYSTLEAGRVLWTEVMGLSEWQYAGQKMVVLLLNDPQCYIDNQPKTLKRKALLFNLKECGSPLALSANGLKISYKRLHALLHEKYAEYQAGVKTPQ